MNIYRINSVIQGGLIVGLLAIPLSHIAQASNQPSETPSASTAPDAIPGSGLLSAQQSGYVKIVNGTSATVVYFMSGERYVLVEGAEQVHSFRVGEAPVIEFDYSYNNGWQAATQNLAPNQTYVFQPTSDTTVGLF